MELIIRYLSLVLFLVTIPAHAQNDQACFELLRGGLIAIYNGDNKTEDYMYDRFDNECEVNESLRDVAREEKAGDNHYGKLLNTLVESGLL